VLYVGGLSLVLLALFFYVIDVRGVKRWAFFFSVIGMNSILIYMSGQFIRWRYTTEAFFEWLIDLVGEPYNALVFVVCLILIKWLFLYLLYRKNVFLRV
jgi:predicted acyltransferase